MGNDLVSWGLWMREGSKFVAFLLPLLIIGGALLLMWNVAEWLWGRFFPDADAVDVTIVDDKRR